MEVLTETASKAKRITVRATFNINLARRDLPEKTLDTAIQGNLADRDSANGFFVTAEEWTRLKPSIDEAASQILAGLDLLLPPGSTVDLGEIHVGFEDSD